jgi:hypothetical protein
LTLIVKFDLFPLERIKNKRWHLLPIVPFAKQLIEELQLFSGHSEYLMPGSHDPNAMIHKTSLGHTLKEIQKNIHSSLLSYQGI